MKSKSEIIAAVCKTAEDKILVANLMDKAKICADKNYLTTTKFLNMNERTICEQAIRLMGKTEARSVFWGGYEDAERGLVLFYPDYLEEQTAKEQAPIVLLRASKNTNDELAHRDFLGALMGLQIDRTVIGDILVNEMGADIFVMEDIADFILTNFEKAGRKRIILEQIELSERKEALCKEEEANGTVSSPRLDSIISLIFRISRTEAQNYIKKGLVFINHIPCLKNEKEISEHDKITVRGLGKAKIDSFNGKSKKGRLIVKFIKYI